MDQKPSTKEKIPGYMIGLIVIVVAMFVFNQFQIMSVTSILENGVTTKRGSSQSSLFSGGKDVSKVELTEIKSTGHTIAALFPIEDIKTTEDAMAMLFPTGTP